MSETSLSNKITRHQRQRTPSFFENKVYGHLLESRIFIEMESWPSWSLQWFHFWSVLELPQQFEAQEILIFLQWIPSEKRFHPFKSFFPHAQQRWIQNLFSSSSESEIFSKTPTSSSTTPWYDDLEPCWDSNPRSKKISSLVFQNVLSPLRVFSGMNSQIIILDIFINQANIHVLNQNNLPHKNLPRWRSQPQRPSPHKITR